MNIKYWKILNEESNDGKSLVEKLSENRKKININDEEDFDEIFNTPSMADMNLAVDRIRKAIYNEEKIAIYGDYDCDGITSTALLYSYLENQGADIIYYIPERDSEGYGLNKEAVKLLKNNDVNLIITVDNGVTAMEEIDYASALGMDVVVTDHHQPRDVLPNAVAVVDPHRKDCPSGLTYLCGVGVVFELITAMEEGDYYSVLNTYADIAAIGTVADAVELIGKNRAIVKKGLELINDGNRIGIQSLLRISGISPEIPATSETLAFAVAPRINAAGRVGDVEVALVLLLTEDYEQAASLSSSLNEYNNYRRELEKGILSDIKDILTENKNILNERIILIKGKNWHHGVTGIVCSKVSEKYGKPCILFSDDGKEARGSGRSIEGFNLIEAVSQCGSCLVRYGGHPMAAGLTLRSENFELFREKILSYARESSFIMPTAVISVDCEVSPDMLNLESVKSLGLLEPFGVGNETPVFCIKNAVLTGIVPLSGGKHIKLKAEKNGKVFSVLCFGITAEKLQYSVGDNIDIAFTADINSYMGKESVSLKLKDIRYSEINQNDVCMGKRIYELFEEKEDLSKFKADIIPCRDDGAVVYRWLKNNGRFIGDSDMLFFKSKIPMSYCKFKILIKVMEELGLIKAENEIDIIKVKEKKDFNSSKILKQLSGV